MRLTFEHVAKKLAIHHCRCRPVLVPSCCTSLALVRVHDQPEVAEKVPLQRTFFAGGTINLYKKIKVLYKLKVQKNRRFSRWSACSRACSPASFFKYFSPSGTSSGRAPNTEQSSGGGLGFHDDDPVSEAVIKSSQTNIKKSDASGCLTGYCKQPTKSNDYLLQLFAIYAFA